MPLKSKPKRWLRIVDDLDFAIDTAIERVRKRDGKAAYEAASQELLTFLTNTIVHIDGGPDRLLRMLRRLEEMHADDGQAPQPNLIQRGNGKARVQERPAL